ncbi:MAG TPA: CopG family antitoxin [Candidatus Woesebacteria bacterium]|nr:CopG family antitoxin [Candidatus Woesebacteria bacterium]
MKKLKRIPQFKNEEEEREFWWTHDSTEYFDWSKAERINFSNLKPTSRNSSIHYEKPASKNDYVFDKNKDK